MFSKIKTSFSLSFCFVLFTASLAYGQTQDNRDAEVLINSITEKAGANFKEGLIALKDNLRPVAREKFDKAIEVFLMSALNVQRNPKLLNCYNQLVDTIYLIEFPTSQKPPQIKTLSATCGWNVNDQLANDITNLVLTNPVIGSGTATSNTNTNPLEKIQGGFIEEKFEPSPLDELAKLELTAEEQTSDPIKNETWQSISNRTGVSVKDLMAANGNTPLPGKKVVIPQGNNLKNPIYSRPITQSNSISVVKAQKDDTVTTLAARNKVSAVEVAQLNGLLTTTKLPAGREIKIPNISNTAATQQYQYITPAIQSKKLDLGAKPVQMKNGKVRAVLNFINEYFNDPYSVRFVRWSKVEQKSYRGVAYWSVQVKLRAKNAFGAYILTEEIYYIKNNKVVASQKLY